MEPKPSGILASCVAELSSQHAGEHEHHCPSADVYFRELCPALHIQDKAFLDAAALTLKSSISINGASVAATSQPLVTSHYDERRLRRSMDEKGFAVLPPGVLQFNANHPTTADLLDAASKGPSLPKSGGVSGSSTTVITLAALASAAAILEAAGWPATFLLAFDEVWVALAQLEPVLQKSSGGCLCNFDLLCWHVKPGMAGFSPHRDRQPMDVPSSFRPDGSPKYATCWVALGGANTAQNSILYVIPRGIDPGYALGDDSSGDGGGGGSGGSGDGGKGSGEGGDPLATCLRSDKANYQHIRALPTEAGGACLFSHRTIHWGSSSEPLDERREEKDEETPPPPPTMRAVTTPRVSFSFASSDPEFEPPYMDRHHPHLKAASASASAAMMVPPLSLRLALACAQMIVYHQRFDTPLPLLRNMFALFKHAHTVQHQGVFHQSYIAKVNAEFASAVQEICSSNSSSSSSSSITSSSSNVAMTQRLEDSDDDDDQEAALDEALSAALAAEIFSSSSASSSASVSSSSSSSSSSKVRGGDGSKDGSRVSGLKHRQDLSLLPRDDFDDEFSGDEFDGAFENQDDEDHEDDNGDDNDEEEEEEFSIEDYMRERQEMKRQKLYENGAGAGGGGGSAKSK